MGNETAGGMSKIAIIGAGIGGSTLARCLKRKGIPFVVYEKVNASPRYNYAITIEPTTSRLLSEALDIDDAKFRSRVAVDSPVNAQDRTSSSSSKSGEFRAHRQKLESLIRDDIEVKWEHLVKTIELEPSPTIHFENGTSASHSHIIAADGVHSSVRNTLLDSNCLSVLPYVAINGKRRIPRKLFLEKFLPAFEKETSLTLELVKNDIVLSIDVFDQTEESISVNYIYSRRPRKSNDELYRPSRSNSDATQIPEALYEEIKGLGELPAPFDEIFNAKELRGERKLSWLMRTSSIPLDRLRQLSRQGIAFIGDAVHAQPILGGSGANSAIQDAAELADFIVGNGIEKMGEWTECKFSKWVSGVKRSDEAIAAMHPSISAQTTTGNL